MPKSARLALTLLAGLSTASCSFDAFTYTVDRYGTVSARQIHLGCRDTYEIFDRPAAGSLLVVTNGLNEALADTCATGPETLPKPARMRRAAELYLEETTTRPDCRIVRQEELSGFHTEFGYRCPAPPAAKAETRSTKPRRRG